METLGKYLLFLVMVSFIWVNPVWAQGEADIPKASLVNITAEGKINGLHCYARDTQFPINRTVHIGVEKDYCLMTPKGIYHLSNLGSEVTSLHVGHTMRVTGKLEEVSKSVFVNKLDMLMDDGKFKTVWAEKDLAKAVTEEGWFRQSE